LKIGHYAGADTLEELDKSVSMPVGSGAWSWKLPSLGWR